MAAGKQPMLDSMLSLLNQRNAVRLGVPSEPTAGKSSRAKRALTAWSRG
jgi:hypothetical protein